MSSSSTSPQGVGDVGKAGGGGAERCHTRTLLVTIEGNRAVWDCMGSSNTLWRVNPEQASSIFSAGASDDRIRRALIRKLTVLSSNTNVDGNLSVIVDDIPYREFTANGEGSNLVLCGQGYVTTPQELYSLNGNTELGLAWMQKYPKYSVSNIESEGVIILPGSNYYFVEENHPCIHMLKCNTEQWEMQLLEQSVVHTAGWYRVGLELFRFCVKSIKEEILQNAPSTFDLSALTVRIKKPDSETWCSLTPSLVEQLSAGCESDTAKIQAVERYVEKPLFLTLRLCLEYSLPDGATA